MYIFFPLKVLMYKTKVDHGFLCTKKKKNIGLYCKKCTICDNNYSY